MQRKNRTKLLSVILISGVVSFLFIIAGTFIYAQNPVTDTVKNKSQKSTKTMPKIGEEVYPPGTTGGPMVLIPAGKFMMGCNEAVDNQCGNDEKPYHRVYLDAYYIDKYEVTVAEYEKCIPAGERENPSTSHHCNWGESDRGNHPMNCINWNDAKNYCEWAGKRLPTEAEWEKAARGTDGRKYPWGNITATCKYAVMDQGGKGCGEYSTWPVGSKPKGASPYGLMDMAGNVWEWVQDTYDENFYSGSPGRNPGGSGWGDYRVLRGGGWIGNAGYLRASDRGYYPPTLRDGNGGFRCARDAD